MRRHEGASYYSRSPVSVSAFVFVIVSVFVFVFAFVFVFVYVSVSVCSDSLHKVDKKRPAGAEPMHRVGRARRSTIAAQDPKSQPSNQNRCTWCSGYKRSMLAV